MENSGLPKGQRVTSPDGPGEVIETIGDEVIIKLDSGAKGTYPMDDVVDESSAG